MAIEFGSPEAAAIIFADKRLDYEIRREVVATVACKCGREVELEAETDEWYHEEVDNTWRHLGFGPAQVECECERIYVDYWEGTFMIEPEESR